jgi:uncharacterized protein (DUF1501 family)
MYARRDFLKASLRQSTLIALAPTVPGFLARAARAATADRDGRVLVVVELNGGNDGINTVVPFKDEGYARHRKVLRLPRDRLLKIDDSSALHPAMGAAGKLLESGRLAIVQGVGYPNPNRSHFESMAIWQTARFDREQRSGLGWIGRAFDEAARPADGSPAALRVGDSTVPVALWGRRSAASALIDPEDFRLRGQPGARPSATSDGPADDLRAFVGRNLLDSYATADRMSRVVRVRAAGTGSPDTALAGQLRLIAGLLQGGVGTRVFYAVQTGYDTHYLQLAAHADLLAELAGALKAFLDDLAADRLADRVAVLCFSEFGRRVAENGSEGTDHGTAGPVFLAGPAVRPGLVGPCPSLTDLVDGDLKMTVDFRRFYAAVLEGWLGLSSKTALGGTYEPLPLFRG